MPLWFCFQGLASPFKLFWKALWSVCQFVTEKAGLRSVTPITPGQESNFSVKQVRLLYLLHYFKRRIKTHKMIDVPGLYCYKSLIKISKLLQCDSQCACCSLEPLVFCRWSRSPWWQWRCWRRRPQLICRTTFKEKLHSWLSLITPTLSVSWVMYLNYDFKGLHHTSAWGLS